MNLLLVDDEVSSLNILKSLVNWEKLGIQQVYTAYSADAARDIILSSRVHILLCDIEMPGESGLSLIKWVQDAYPEIVSIILTGFPEFNYARSAISLGVFRYLLKPVEIGELEEAILSAILQIEEEEILYKDQKKKYEQNQSAVAKTKQYLEEHYNEVITRSDIENLVHLSQDHLNREFKRIEGFTLLEYVQHYRIIMAKKFLRESSKSIADISLDIGYDSQAYFSKILKKRTGKTPMEYRAEHSKDAVDRIRG